MGGPGLVVLTDKRLCLVVDYAFRPDQGLAHADISGY
jgi:hypothetical protein